MKAVDEMVRVFRERCRKAGLKVTHQRVEIYRVLCSTDVHPDAETVYVRVKQKIPCVSLDTVYRTLRMLEEKGIISSSETLGERSRYDANTERHHHFVCEECGMIADFYCDELDRFPLPRKVAAMGSVDRVCVELRGLCRKCRPAVRK